MKTQHFIVLALALFSTTLINAQSGITGTWNGVLDFQGIQQLRIVFHIQEENGVYTATMDSPDQGATGIPTQGLSYEHPNLSIDMSALGAKFTGVVAEDFSTIDGTFSQAGMNLELKLGRAEVEMEAPKRPQEPQPPFPYYEEKVTFDNKAAGITLAGTLTLPSKKGKYPVVVLVSGSGPQNRDEELLGHKPFLVLADHLTRQGIGVLRYDDRGVAESTGDFSSATSADFASDALAAVEYLKKRKGVNKKQIGIAGHSEGGLIAPMCAAQSKDVAFIVLLAGPGVDGEEVLIKQIADIERAQGTSEEKIQTDLRKYRQVFRLIKTEQDTSRLRLKLSAMLESEMGEQAENTKEQVKKEVDEYLSPWFRHFIQYDPRTSLEKVRCPVLAINGEKDLQVDPKINLEAIEAALKKGGNTRYMIQERPGLNHLFQSCTTGSPMEYNKIEQTFSPVALEFVSGWILKTLGKN